jgi:amino acid permease
MDSILYFLLYSAFGLLACVIMKRSSFPEPGWNWQLATNIFFGWPILVVLYISIRVLNLMNKDSIK